MRLKRRPLFLNRRPRNNNNLDEVNKNFMSKIAWIIVVVAVLAGIVGYFWYGPVISRQSEQGYGASQEAASADAAAVESELQSIQTDGLDAELSDIEKEIAQ